MWYLHFLLNTSPLNVIFTTEKYSSPHYKNDKSNCIQSKANIICYLDEISQDGIPANYCSTKCLRHSTHGNLTKLLKNYKNQINIFKTHNQKLLHRYR